MTLACQDMTAFHSLVTHDGRGGKQAPELMMQAHVVVLFLRNGSNTLILCIIVIIIYFWLWILKEIRIRRTSRRWRQM
jgi:hypothetical protein